MINGGYKIISLSSPTVHDDIENNYLKAIMLTDIVIDGIEKPDIFVSEYSVVSGNFVFDVYDKTVTVTADNEVTYTDGGKHLYSHNIRCSYTNANGDAQYIVFSLYLNKSSEISNETELYNLLNNKNRIAVSSTVNSLSDLNDSTVTLACYIEVYENELYIYVIDDEAEIEFSNFTLMTDDVTKIF